MSGEVALISRQGWGERLKYSFEITDRKTRDPLLLTVLLGCSRQLDEAKTCCQKFLSSLSEHDDERRRQVRIDTIPAFNMMLDMVASLHVLEPFEPDQVSSAQCCDGLSAILEG